MDFNEILGIINSTGDNPVPAMTALFGYFWVKSSLGQNKAESVAVESKTKAEEVKDYARIAMRALDLVVKAIDLANAKEVKAAVTELSRDDPEAREVIIKAVDRRKISDRSERKALAESEAE